MFNSVFAKEMTAFLELRRSNVSVQTLAHDTVTLAKLDCHLTVQDYREKDLSEEILLTWIRTLSEKQDGAIESALRQKLCEVSHGMGGHSFLRTPES